MDHDEKKTFNNNTKYETKPVMRANASDNDLILKANFSGLVEII